MTARSKDTPSISRKPRSDLAKVDAHVITRDEYDEIPELTDEFFEHGVMSKSLTVLPMPRLRGRPKKADAKVHQGLRLSPDVLAAFRATGPKWQARIDGALREWLVQHKLLPQQKSAVGRKRKA